ncbi:unnamed protein product, partial [Amoebophrya sp. A25]
KDAGPGTDLRKYLKTQTADALRILEKLVEAAEGGRPKASAVTFDATVITDPDEECRSSITGLKADAKLGEQFSADSSSSSRSTGDTRKIALMSPDVITQKNAGTNVIVLGKDSSGKDNNISTKQFLMQLGPLAMFGSKGSERRASYVEADTLKTHLEAFQKGLETAEIAGKL